MLEAEANNVGQSDHKESDLGLHASSFPFLIHLFAHAFAGLFAVREGSIISTFGAWCWLWLLAGRIVGNERAELVRHLVFVFVLKINYKEAIKQISISKSKSK